MLDTKNNLRKNIISILIILLLSFVFCMLIYKSQVEWEGDTRIKYTLMSTHKNNGEVVLSKDNPVVYEDFICNVPSLKKIQIEGVVDGSLSKSNLLVEVIGLDTGKTYYKKQGLVSSFYNSKAKKKVYKLKKMPADTEGMVLRVIVTLETEADGRLVLTSNNKPGTVLSFDGNAYDYTNIIYRMRYGYVSELSGLYWFLCIWFVCSLLIIYYLVVIKQCRCEKWFPILALLLGLAVQWIIPVYGVPDEPWHMDTAYQLSNTIMRVDKEHQEGTVLKRECDIVTSDLLANDVESNSYYQLVNNTFKKPVNTSLKRVAYVDSGNQVPDIVYLPAALGITVGRIAGASGMMTYQLARVISLLVYILLVWLAVKLTPFCNTVTAMAGISLIALQQGASASYDAVINGVIMLFTAVALATIYANRETPNKLYIVLLIVTALLIVTVKGGVYIPALLLLMLLFKEFIRKNGSKKKSIRRMIITLAVVIVAAISAAILKFYPVVKSLLESTEVHGGERYTLSEVISHPLAVLYMYWRTIMKSGETYLRGMFGGMLGWHNIKVSWIFMLPVIVGVWLLVHVENERPPRDRSYKVIAILAPCMVVALVMLAMLFAETTITASTIWGIQGRYFVPIIPLMMSAFSTPIITVGREKSARIIYTMIISEMLAAMQILVTFI